MNLPVAMTTPLFAGLLTLALAACGTSATHGTADHALTLSKARIFQVSDKDNALEVAADGSITLDGKPAGKMHTDGKVYDTQGRLRLTLKPNGQLVTPEGKALSLRLTSDNTLVGPKGTSWFDETGAFVGGNPNSPKIGSAGCSGPTVRTCLVAIAVMLSSVSESSTSATP